MRVCVYCSLSLLSHFSHDFKTVGTEDEHNSMAKRNQYKLFFSQFTIDVLSYFSQDPGQHIQFKSAIQWSREENEFREREREDWMREEIN